jgi:hypothetical protein
MKRRMASGLFYAVVLVLALWLNSTWAKSSVPSFVDGGWVMQGVPAFVDGAWVMPPRPVQNYYQSYNSGFNTGWEQHAAEACAVYGCDPGYLMSIIMCESGGDPGAAAYNPSSGNMTLGLLQIDELWGSIAYADGVSQIYWAAERLAAGQGYLWVCG